ncbi:non-specific lipid-transfer protein-like [Cynara cardunculus var. scolymus]
MASMMMKFLCVAVACMVVLAPYSEAITCDDVVEKLKPCLEYLKGGGAVPAPCCAGVKGLNAAAKTTPDRQTACGCMKTTYKSHPEIKVDNARVLPGKCGVKIPYKISPKTDCSKVK